MPDVNEEIVHLYFKNNNSLIRTNVKYYVMSEKNVGGDSDIDIIAYNLNPDKVKQSDNFIIKTDDLKGIEHAAIEFKGRHTMNFVPSVIKSFPRIFYFTRPEADTKVKEIICTAHYKKILVLSSLGTANKTEESIALLKKGSIDHIIEFKEIISNICDSVETNKNYASEALQMVRLFKIYKGLQ